MSMHALLDSPWFWWGMALALFALEALLPGTFMLWLGFAAVGTAMIGLLVPMPGAAAWMLFAILSLISVAIGWQYKQKHGMSPSDQPLLNRRGAQLVGQVFALDVAIVDGRGRVKIGDAYWAVHGPELPAGTRVQVLAVDGMTLRVDTAA